LPAIAITASKTNAASRVVNLMRFSEGIVAGMMSAAA